MSSSSTSMKEVEEQRFKCEKCNRYFNTSRTLASHMNFHAPKSRYQHKHPIAWFNPTADSDPDPDSGLVQTRNLAPVDHVAACNLMMLSSDSWVRRPGTAIIGGSSNHASTSATSASVVRRARTHHVCGTCGRVFRSYQALGGHRASHVKAGYSPWVENDIIHGNGSGGDQVGPESDKIVA